MMTTEAILEVGHTPGRTKQWKVIQKVSSRKREKADKSTTKRIYLRRNYRTANLQRTLKITEEGCVLEAPEDTTNSNEIMQSAVVNSDSSQQGSMIDTLEDRLIQLQPRQLQHRQVTHMLYNKKK